MRKIEFSGSQPGNDLVCSRATYPKTHALNIVLQIIYSTRSVLVSDVRNPWLGCTCLVTTQSQESFFGDAFQAGNDSFNHDTQKVLLTCTSSVSEDNRRYRYIVPART